MSTDTAVSALLPRTLGAPTRSDDTRLRGPVLLAADGTAPTDAAAATARRVAEHLGVRVEVLAILEPLPAYALVHEPPIVPTAFEAERRRRLEDAVVRRLEPVLGSRATWHVDVREGTIGRAIADAARDVDASLVVLGSGGHRAIHRLFGEEIPVQVIRHATCPVLVVAPGLSETFRRAVVGVDFSAASIRAVLTTLALLDPGPREAAVLTLVHVRSPFEHDFPLLGPWAEAYDDDIATRFVRLRELLRPSVPSGVTVETRTRVGSVPGFLLESADAIAAQLVAVGTHGAGWMERLFLGSVATNVLRQPGRTVLVTPPPDAAERLRLELAIEGEAAFDQPDDWTAALDAFTQRNEGRAARLEVTAPQSAGLAVVAARYPFLGADFDPHDRCVELMLGDESCAGTHVTHTIHRVQAIEVVARGAAGRDHALVVDDARGQAVLTFLD